MSAKLRVTGAVLEVLGVLMGDPSSEHWGYDIMRKANIRSGTLYPLLARFEDNGLVESRLEDRALFLDVGRPPRRYYKLTGDGVEWAADALSRTGDGKAGSRRIGRQIAWGAGT